MWKIGCLVPDHNLSTSHPFQTSAVGRKDQPSGVVVWVCELNVPVCLIFESKKWWKFGVACLELLHSEKDTHNIDPNSTAVPWKKVEFVMSIIRLERKRRQIQFSIGS